MKCQKYSADDFLIPDGVFKFCQTHIWEFMVVKLSAKVVTSSKSAVVVVVVC